MGRSVEGALDGYISTRLAIYFRRTKLKVEMTVDEGKTI